jgi:hypothetical protein
MPLSPLPRLPESLTHPPGQGLSFLYPQCPFIQSSAIVGHLVVILPVFVLFFPFRSISLASVHFPLHFHWPFPLPSSILNKLLRNCRCISFAHIDQRGEKAMNGQGSTKWRRRRHKNIRPKIETTKKLTARRTTKRIQPFELFTSFSILLFIILQNISPVECYGACKGCIPPCICPGQKGEQVNSFNVFWCQQKIDSLNHFILFVPLGLILNRNCPILLPILPFNSHHCIFRECPDSRANVDSQACREQMGLKERWGHLE